MKSNTPEASGNMAGQAAGRSRLKRRTVLGLLPAALGMGHWSANAQLLDKPVRLIVPFPAGGSMDVSARILAGGLRGVYAENIQVENRTGASGRIANDYVKGTAPDGTTILITANLLFTIYPYIYSKLNYELNRDLVPVVPICSAGFSISVGPAVPESVRTIADYGKWVAANPKFATFGSGSTGTTQHFIGMMLGRSLNVPLEHVGYRGGAPLAADLMGGTIAMGVQSLPDTIELVKAGRVRSLAVTTAQRSHALPNVATLGELGFPELVLSDITGTFVPSKTPAEIVRKLGNAVHVALAKPEVQEQFRKMSFQVLNMDQAAYAQSIEREAVVWKKVVQASGFKAEE